MITRITCLLLFPFAIFAKDITPISTALKTLRTDTFQSYVVTGNIYNYHENKTDPFTLRFVSTPSGLDVSVVNPLCLSAVSLDQRYQVMNSTFNIYEQFLIERTKYDFRSGYRNPLDEVVFNFSLKGKEVKEKGLYYTSNTIDTFSIVPVFQAIAPLPDNYFSADLAVEHLGMKVPILIKKELTNRLDKYLIGYSIQPELEAKIKSHITPSIVFVFKVTGWQGFFYNHRHIYVFSGTYPHQYLGHWGGSDKLNLFSWAN
jgi:hypothetical protein